MTNLLNAIIMVLPGFIAYLIFRKIAPAEEKVLSDFERTIIGLVYNIPGMVIAWVAVSVGVGQKLTFDEFQTHILMMPCFIEYMIIVFLSAIFTALMWNDYGKEWLRKWVDKERKEKLRPTSYPETPWETFFGAEKTAFFAVYQIDKKIDMIFGAVSRSFKPGDIEKGIVLKTTKDMKKWYPWFGNPLRMYIDTTTKMVYEYYPASAWDEARRRAREHRSTQKEAQAEVVPPQSLS